MTITIHRGIGQIGGCVTEYESHELREEMKKRINNMFNFYK